MNKRPELIKILVWILAVALICVVALQACVATPTPDPSHLDVNSSFTLVAKSGNIEVWRMTDQISSISNLHICYVAVNNYTSVASASISCP